MNCTNLFLFTKKLSEQFSWLKPEDTYRSNLKVVTDNGDASAANSFAIDVMVFTSQEEIAYNEFNEDGEQDLIFKI
jgi:hypothetical protein